MAMIFFRNLLVSITCLLAAPAQANPTQVLMFRQDPKLFLQSQASLSGVSPSLAILQQQAEGLKTLPYQISEDSKKAGELSLLDARSFCNRIFAVGLSALANDKGQFQPLLLQDLKTLLSQETPPWYKYNSSQTALPSAEMGACVSLMLNWFENEIPIEARRALADRIWRETLKPIREILKRGSAFYLLKASNQAFVVLGGALIASLAVESYLPIESQELQSLLIPAFDLAMSRYYEDGSWAESPGYWLYGAEYMCLALQALRSVKPELAADLLEKHQSKLKQTAYWIIYAGKFGYGDGGGSGPTAIFQFLGSVYQDPLVRAYRAKPLLLGENRFIGYHVLYYQDAGDASLASTLPRHYVSYPSRVAVFQGKTAYFASKGGSNQDPHTHLDLGSFIYQALGQTWAEELGKDDYSLPGYFQRRQYPDSPAYRIYRLRAEGQNTLTIGEATTPDQNILAQADFVKDSVSLEGNPRLQIDLSAAYSFASESVLRSFQFDRETDRLTVQDEIKAAKGPIRFHLHVKNIEEAKFIDANQRLLKLSKAGKSLVLRLSGDGEFESCEEQVLCPDEPGLGSPIVLGQASNAEFRKIRIINRNPKESVRYQVEFIPIFNADMEKQLLTEIN